MAANMIRVGAPKEPAVWELGSNDRLITGEPTTNDFFICQRFLMGMLQWRLVRLWLPQVRLDWCHHGWRRKGRRV
jgi:hypothetical protein